MDDISWVCLVPSDVSVIFIIFFVCKNATWRWPPYSGIPDSSCYINLYIYNFSSFNFRLDDNAWHSVLVEKNRKESMVVIDGARKGQSKEGRGPVRPMLLTSGLFIGANQDSSDGFVGCMRALVLNGVNIDLQVLFFFVKSHCRFHDFHKFSFFY